MFTGLTSYTTHANVTEYNNLVDSYHYAIVVSAEEQGVDLGEYAWLIDDGDYEVGDWSTEKETAYQQFFTEKVAPLANSSGPMADTEKYDAIIEGTKPIVGDFAGTNRESFLWIKNIWRPDTWATVMPTYSEFTNGSLAVSGIKGANEPEYQIIYEAVGEYAGGYAGSVTVNGTALDTATFSIRGSSTKSVMTLSTEVKMMASFSRPWNLWTVATSNSFPSCVWIAAT